MPLSGIYFQCQSIIYLEREGGGVWGHLNLLIFMGRQCNQAYFNNLQEKHPKSGGNIQNANIYHQCRSHMRSQLQLKQIYNRWWSNYFIEERDVTSPGFWAIRLKKSVPIFMEEQNYILKFPTLLKELYRYTKPCDNINSILASLMRNLHQPSNGSFNLRFST